MSLAYLFDSNIQFQDKSGNNNVNGFLRVFIDNTDDRAVTYKDFNGTLNQADIRLDNNGRAVVIVDDSKTYRLEVYGTTGVLLWTLYPISPKATGINETLEALVAAVKSHTIAIEGLALGKKNKQQAKVISGTTTQTVKSLSQNADGEITVEFEDIDFPYNIQINSPDDSIEVGTPVVDPERKEETIPISVKRPGLVKADSADTEPGTLIDKLEIEDTIDDDHGYHPLLEIHPADGKVAINEDGLHESLDELSGAIDGIIETIDEMDWDSVPRAYLASTLNQSPGDSVTTRTTIDVFSVTAIEGECFEFEETTTIDDVPFGYVWIEPGTYLINASVTLQWVGNPRGTFVAKVGSVMGENFDFSQEQEISRQSTKVVTIPSRMKLAMNVTYDAGTPVMGFWIQSMQVVKLAGGMSQTNIIHDDTLVGRGSVADPLGVDEEKVAQSTLAGNLAPAFDAEHGGPNNDGNYPASYSVVYQGKFYTFKVNHSGAWNASDVDEDNAATKSVQENLVKSICRRFLETKDYEEGEFVELDGMIYRFKDNHSAGAWNSSHVEEWDWDSILFSIIKSEVAASRAAALSIGGFFVDGIAWSYRTNDLNCVAFLPISNYIVDDVLYVYIQCRELAGQTLNVSGHSSDKSYLARLADVTLDAEGVAVYSVAITNPAIVYIRLYKQDSGDLISKRKFFYGGKIIASSDSLNNNLKKFNAIGYEDAIESISLENKLYEPMNITPIESTAYWSKKLLLKAGDKIGFLDDSLWSQVKMNFGKSSWMGYQSENVTIPSDGTWTIAITRIPGATIAWDETINDVFGKIVKRPCVKETGLSAEVQAKLNKGSNPLVGKKLACLGDSLTHGMGLNNDQTWGYMIAERNAMTFYNYGIDGNPIASKGDIHGMSERYTQMPDGCQYITVMGGANDMNQEIPIGDNSDSTIYTFKGAINVLIDGLRTKYPSGHICFMTSFKRYPNTQEKNYADAMREVCALKAIPCKDNYTDSGIDFTNASQAAVFEHQAYGKHFNEAGNEFISWGIEAFLKAH